MRMTLTPSDIRASFDALSDEDKIATGLIPAKTNTSWAPIREAVEKHLKKKKSFSLQDLRNEGIVPIGTKSRALKLCVIEPLRNKGVKISEQKGVLPRNATLFHSPGKGKKVEAPKKTVFTYPDKETAKYVAEHLINGQIGSINVRNLMDKKQFPFITQAKSRKKFEPLLIDEAEKLGCKQTGTPFVFVREVKQ